ncbi:reverse transcriptase [Plakobranchus ocellatus]|uniref:Reverse transcriptase n=1 Tax=Plakobranchus ocellatus TaxID=259542 RepID=A0AAV3ZD05_9GAST|nr:reverse transcriptase [Plakobranchus ocellatus]
MLHATPKAFMHDTSIMCSRENDTRRMLVRLDALMNLSGMCLKQHKSRSLSTRKGNLDKDVCFKVVNQDIPRISREPMKSLERWYDLFLKDTKRGFEA